jgi:hypothetical protein
MNKIAVTLIFLFTSFSVLAAEGFSSLEEQMSGKEFQAAGLDKLSQQELDALNDWLRRHSVATLDTPKSAPAASTSAAAATPVATAETQDRRGFKNEDKDNDEPIVSRLVGNSSGWDGQTVFKLENGMIWAQADKDKLYVGKDIPSPEVTIKKRMFGNWYLSMEGYDSKCKVVRIQ